MSDARSPSPLPSPAALRARVLDAVRHEPSPPRRTRVRHRMLTLALGFIGAGIVTTATQRVDHRAPLAAGRALWHVAAEDGALVSRPASYVVTLEVLWLAVAACATWAAIGRGRSMIGRPKRTKTTVAAVTPCLLLAIWLTVTFSWLDATDSAPSDVSLHLSCALLTVVYAAGPFVAFFLLQWRRELRDPAHAGAAMAVAAGAWGAVILFPFCDCTSPLHAAVGHVLPVVALAIIGASAGRRMLAPRLVQMRVQMGE